MIAGISVFLLMVPSSSIFATDLSSITPNTIPLWGPTWCKDGITWRIDNQKNITPSALEEMEKAIADWSAHTPVGFSISKAGEGETPDVTLKFKKGGGRIQGTAHQNNDAGCFTKVRISVSGKAFGLDNPGDQVRSITSQEFGHGLGLLHSDNLEDVMFGTVQETPNIKLSLCDIEAWNAVMDWLIKGEPSHPPTVSSVSCPDTNGGGSGGPEPTSCVGTIPDGNNLAEKVSKISFDIKSKGRFNDLLITVHVSDSENDVSDALVKLNLCRDGRDQPWQFQGSTDQNGDVTFKLGKARSNTPYSAYIVNDDQFHLTSELCSVAKISSSSVKESAC